MIKAISFGGSFVTWKLQQGLFGRFTVESAISITSGTRHSETWYLLSNVMACKVLEGEQMINEPEYFFMAAFSRDYFRIWRMNNTLGSSKDSAGLTAAGFEDVAFHISTSDQEPLKHNEIVKLTLNNVSLSGLIHFSVNDASFSISFPVKHINVKPSNSTWQVETGPVLMPEFVSNDHLEPLNWRLAFIALNNNGDLHAAYMKDTNKHIRFYQAAEPLKVKANIFRNS